MLSAAAKHKSSMENNGMYCMYHPDIRAGTEDGVQGVQWAHHEKLVIIDQSTAFVGGIDLCIGRYEIHGRNSLRKFSFPGMVSHILSFKWHNGPSLMKCISIPKISRNPDPNLIRYMESKLNFCEIPYHSHLWYIKSQPN